MFDFEEKNNTYFDFVFGYNNEILGKAVFAISFDQIYFLMNNKIPLDQLNIKLIFENEKDENLDYQDTFELIVLEENEYKYSFNSFGYY